MSEKNEYQTAEYDGSKDAIEKIFNINPGIDNENKKYPEPADEKDPWADRSGGMKCKTCVFYVEKKSSSTLSIEIGRCRRNAPTMKGYPVVYPNDWCGEHRMDEEKLLCG